MLSRLPVEKADQVIFVIILDHYQTSCYFSLLRYSK